jgi:cytochrome c oxidase accessory protein FixG
VLTTLDPPSASRGEVERLDVAAVNSAGARKLYAAREPIYPKLVYGRFRAIKWIALVATLAVYYLLPWVRWPRGAGEPSQAVLVDFPNQRFYFFFIKLWPDDLYFLTGLLVMAALALFLATAMFGRVWCGYACPQTVWTDLYIAVERLIEGDRNKRIKLARAPWTGEKIVKKAVKHGLWVLIAAGTGGAWIFYFHDAPTTLPKIFTGEAPATAYIFLGLLTFTTYLFAGSMREQVCTYMCPWPRIQAALTDKETLQVTYRRDRGEPRGAHKKGQSWDGRGDCVDCNACVAACPMGIDIRDGAQLECINCALCIDACDETMGKIGRPPGLIMYDTDANIDRRLTGRKPVIRLLRARTALYAGLIAVIGALMAFGLSTRSTLEGSVQHDRTPAFVRLSDGSIRNAYTVKIVNKASRARTLKLTLEDIEGAALSAVGETINDGSVVITSMPDSVRSVRIFITAPPQRLPTLATSPTLVISEAGGTDAVRITTSFVKARP